MYGYGAYGITEDVLQSAHLRVDRARGVYAFAHVRGGGAYGKTGIRGTQGTKANTWKDAIAAGEW